MNVKRIPKQNCTLWWLLNNFAFEALNILIEWILVIWWFTYPFFLSFKLYLPLCIDYQEKKWRIKEKWKSLSNVFVPQKCHFFKILFAVSLTMALLFIWNSIFPWKMSIVFDEYFRQIFIIYDEYESCVFVVVNSNSLVTHIHPFMLLWSWTLKRWANYYYLQIQSCIGSKLILVVSSDIFEN